MRKKKVEEQPARRTEWKAKTRRLGRTDEREGSPNKNTNRNKVGFAFDKHRKKAQRKVITYTSAPLRRPTPPCYAV